MKIRIVVDTNIIISALLGGKARFILFDQRYAFIVNEFILKEVQKYVPLVAHKSGVSQSEINQALALLPLEVVSQKDYRDYMVRAAELIESIDSKDVEVLALVLKEKSFLWSEDKHFDKLEGSIRVLKTEDLL